MPSKGLTVSSECSGILDAQPATVYPASPDVPSRNSKFGFWSQHHCIYFLTIVLSTIVAVGMKFDLTCQQRNLSSTTALQRSHDGVISGAYWKVASVHHKSHTDPIIA